MTTIVLPWPPAALSPNARSHWRALAKAKAAYRALCKGAVIDILPLSNPVPKGDLVLDVTCHPPTKRRYDRDNLLARIKSGIDGMCDALGIDDSRFDEDRIRVREKLRGGAIVVRVIEVLDSLDEKL